MLTGRLPVGAERAVHPIPAGRTLDCRDGWWRAVLIVVEHGRVDLLSPAGARLALPAGTLFTLARLGPATLHNPGPTPAILVTLHFARTGATGD